jgi:hypothetical protein
MRVAGHDNSLCISLNKFYLLGTSYFVICEYHCNYLPNLCLLTISIQDFDNCSRILAAKSVMAILRIFAGASAYNLNTWTVLDNVSSTVRFPELLSDTPSTKFKESVYVVDRIGTDNIFSRDEFPRQPRRITKYQFSLADRNAVRPR